MAALAEAYIHLKPYRLDAENIDRITADLEALSKKIARRLYDRPIDLEVRVEDGSLKTWLTILGLAVGGAYNGVAVYPDFKNGMRELVQDARSFGDQLFHEFFERESVRPNQIYRTERRLKTPGRIYRVITRIEDTQRRLPALSNNETLAVMESIKADLQRIQLELDSDQEMSAILKALPRDKLPQLPKTPDEVRDFKLALRPRDLIGISSITDNGDSYSLNEIVPGYRSLLTTVDVGAPSEPRSEGSRLFRHKTVVVIPGPSDPPDDPPKGTKAVPLLR